MTTGLFRRSQPSRKCWLVLFTTLFLLGAGRIQHAGAQGRLQRVREGMSKRWQESRFNLGKRLKDWREARKPAQSESAAATEKKRRWWQRGPNVKGDVRSAVSEALGGYQRARLKLRQKSRTDSRTEVTTKFFEKIQKLAAKHGWAAVIPALQSVRTLKNERWGSFLGFPEDVRKQVMALSASTAQQQEAEAAKQQGQTQEAAQTAQ